MTEDEFNNLKKGDKVMNDMGETGTFEKFDSGGARLNISSKHHSCQLYYLYELVVKNN